MHRFGWVYTHLNWQDRKLLVTPSSCGSTSAGCGSTAVRVQVTCPEHLWVKRGTFRH
jgi:hypothetical protein